MSAAHQFSRMFPRASYFHTKFLVCQTDRVCLASAGIGRIGKCSDSFWELPDGTFAQAGKSDDPRDGHGVLRRRQDCWAQEKGPETKAEMGVSIGRARCHLSWKLCWGEAEGMCWGMEEGGVCWGQEGWTC